MSKSKPTPSKRITPYATNPRAITSTRKDKLKTDLQRYGDLSGIVHNITDNSLPCGNQRSGIVDINACEIELVKEFSKPDA